MTEETIFALTSLSPAPESVPLIRQCLGSWRAAGLEVRAFNHPDEIARLAPSYDVEFVPVTQTVAAALDRHYVPIKAMLDWAARQVAPALLINADVQLRLAGWEMKRVRWLADGGLCYLARHNYYSDPGLTTHDPFRAAGVLCHGRDVGLLADSWLSLGQPFWDDWVLHAFAMAGRPICVVEFPAALHRRHPWRWTWEHWQRCAAEFDRLTDGLGQDLSWQAGVDLRRRAQQDLARRQVTVRPAPGPIREWVQATFSYRGPKTFLELGAHQGTDTMWLAALPDVSLHAFEPDPRNRVPAAPNVRVHRAAIADRDGSGELILSQQGWGQRWTCSSSIKPPHNHLQRYPVTFGGAVAVELVTLDTFCREQGLGAIDFIWADIQGAEGEMIRGGRETLARTRYLYTEYSDDEMYAGQVTLREIMAMLPDFRVIELWYDEVLLENQKLKC